MNDLCGRLSERNRAPRSGIRAGTIVRTAGPWQLQRKLLVRRTNHGSEI